MTSIFKSGLSFNVVFVSILMLGSLNHIQAQKAEVIQDSLQISFTLTERLAQTEELINMVNKSIAQLQDTSELISFHLAAKSLSKSIADTKNQSDFFLNANHRSWVIQNLLVKWNRINDNSKKLNKQLTEVMQGIERELQTTRDLKTTWITNRAEILKNELGSTLKKPITTLLVSLREEEKLLQQRINDFLNLQKVINSDRLVIEKYIEMMSLILIQDLSNYFKRDNNFIWQRDAGKADTAFGFQFSQTLDFAWNDMREYSSDITSKVIIILILVLTLYFATRSIHKTYVAENPAIENMLFDFRIVKYLGVYIYTIVLLLAILLLRNSSLLLNELLLLLFALPLTIIIISRSKGIVRYILLSFVLLYWVQKISSLFILDYSLSDKVELLIAIFNSILLGGIYLNREPFRIQFPLVLGFFQQALLPFLFMLGFLVIPLHVIGYTSLSGTILNGTISFCYLSSVILISSIVLRDFLKLFEQTSFIKNSVLAQRYYSTLFTAIRLIAYYFLIVSFIRVFSLSLLINSLLQNLWSFGGQFGSFTITVGDVLEFIIILFVSWVVSVVMQVLLEGEILSRINLRRGVAMAIGVIVRYFIIVLGFLLAMATTGFDLTKISILAGALGVGIGFGLQNLVANFIAGLILIFERPFVVDDIIESDQVEGTVKQIGIRASKILTYDGAEVIIPNSNLISNRVSNWTLSSAARRQLIIVRTATNANPDEVITILDKLVKQHESTMQTPEPFVLFEGQVEQSLQFKVYYWVMTDFFKARSEINLRIYHELKAMGVEVPIPFYQIQSKQVK
ncbi:MAG: mechanosensitive ion channel [Cyclobacteriaceae bacterium]|nr:mechanosensitive ion channel [Cyclobacteriaceae bacterium]